MHTVIAIGQKRIVARDGHIGGTFSSWSGSETHVERIRRVGNITDRQSGGTYVSIVTRHRDSPTTAQICTADMDGIGWIRNVINAQAAEIISDVGIVA